jgi:hypothetical protein
VDDKVAVEATAGCRGCRGHSAAKYVVVVVGVESWTLEQKRLNVDGSGSGREASTRSRELERRFRDLMLLRLLPTHKSSPLDSQKPR